MAFVCRVSAIVPGEGTVVVQGGDADLEFAELSVEILSHALLLRQFHARHVDLDAASAAGSAPVSPDRGTKIFRCAQGRVSGCGTRIDGISMFGVASGRGDIVGVVIGNGGRAFAGTTGIVGGDAADPLFRRNPIEQIGQHLRIANAAFGDPGGSDLRRWLIDARMSLAPDPSPGPTMLAGVPLAISLDAGAACCPSRCRSPLSREGIGRRIGRRSHETGCHGQRPLTGR